MEAFLDDADERPCIFLPSMDVMFNATKYVAPEGKRHSTVKDTEAVLILQRLVTLAARSALGDGLDSFIISQILIDEAAAILDPSSVAEDMSAISVPMS